MATLIEKSIRMIKSKTESIEEEVGDGGWCAEKLINFSAIHNKKLVELKRTHEKVVGLKTEVVGSAV